MKKVMKTLIGTLLVLCLVSVSAFAQFSDMPSGERGAVLERAVNNGLLAGFDDNTVRPDAPITRAQMATIVSRAFAPKKSADISVFKDVTPSDWYYDAMAKAVYMEAFKGDGENLNPNSNITREQACIVLSRILDLPLVSLASLDRYSDSKRISIWAKDELSRVVSGGYIPQMDAFRPQESMTRVEFAEIIDKMLPQYITASGEYTASDIKSSNVIVKVGNVKLTGVKGLNNLFIADGVTGDVSVENCKISRVVIRGGRLKVISGEYGDLRAICADTFIDLSVMKSGSYEHAYGKSGKGMIIIPAAESVWQ